MITLAELHSRLDYNKDTGLFKYRRSSRFVKAGDTLSHIHNGYITYCFKGKQYKCHKLAWMYIHGYYPTQEVDHKNRNKLDNRIDNLRLVTRSQNQQNIANASSASVTGVRGVSIANTKAGKRFLARIKLNGKRIYLGYHRTLEAAQAAREAGQLKYFGDYASNAKERP